MSLLPAIGRVKVKEAFSVYIILSFQTVRLDVLKSWRNRACAWRLVRPNLFVRFSWVSYAVAALRSGDDIKTVQGNLGHATAAFTLDVYGHVTDQMKQDSASRMEQFIKTVSGS